MNTSSKNIYFMVLHVVAVALAIEVFVLARQNRELKSPAKQIQARSIEAGDTLDLGSLIPLRGTSLQTGRPSLIFLFTTTCPFCERNLDSWRKLGQEAQSRGIQVVGICLDSNDKAVSYGRLHQIDFPVYVPPSLHKFKEENHVSGVPNTIILSPRRQADRVWLGQLNEEQVREIVGVISLYSLNNQKDSS